MDNTGNTIMDISYTGIVIPPCTINTFISDEKYQYVLVYCHLDFYLSVYTVYCKFLFLNTYFIT